ncbi:hypothetical protein [Mycolicibacterium peregrinum]|uniref:hypothetical protein n=1 Tax=Mycolicibacterium peregrinum TaxID=43304 RepID=UPI003AABBA18
MSCRRRFFLPEHSGNRVPQRLDHYRGLTSNFFNYGELIHYGKHSEEYDKLAEDPQLEAIQHNNFKQAMLGLIHLYFGFSEVIRSAIGLKRPEAA